MTRIEEIVKLMVERVCELPIGSESSVTELLNHVIGPVQYDFTIDELFTIDEMFRREVILNGFILDSMKHDFNPGLPMDRSFVIRKI